MRIPHRNAGLDQDTEDPKSPLIGITLVQNKTENPVNSIFVQRNN